MSNQCGVLVVFAWTALTVLNNIVSKGLNLDVKIACSCCSSLTCVCMWPWLVHVEPIAIKCMIFPF